MKVFVWNGVLPPYKFGVTLAIANNIEEARQQILDRCGQDVWPVVKKEPDLIKEAEFPFSYLQMKS